MRLRPYKEAIEQAKDAVEKQKKSLKNISKTYGILLVPAIGGMAYRFFRTKQEEETDRAARYTTTMGLIPDPGITEYVLRKERTKKAMSDKEHLILSEKRMEKLLQDLQNITPAFPGQCDHIKRS